MWEQQAFDFRQPGQKRRAIPPRKTLAPGTGNYYQQQGTRAPNRPTRHRNVEHLDRPTRTGRQGREDVYVDPRQEHVYRRTTSGGVEIDDEYPRAYQQLQGVMILALTPMQGKERDTE